MLTCRAFLVTQAFPQLRLAVLTLSKRLLMSVLRALKVHAHGFCLLTGTVDLSMAPVFDVAQVDCSGFTLLGRGRLLGSQACVQVPSIGLERLHLQLKAF